MGQRYGFRSSYAKRALVLGSAVLMTLAVLVPWPHPFRSARCDPSLWELPHDLVAYLYALQLEDAWSVARPRNRRELEQHLYLYSTQTISPADSCWGKRYALARGELMVRYSIAWHAPLDVVYDSSGNIRAIFTSYE